MIKFQLIILLPFIALLLILLFNKFPKIENFGYKISTLLAILFLIFSFKLKNLANAISFTFLKLPGNFNLAFLFDANQVLLLSTLGIFWITACLNFDRYFLNSADQKRAKFHILLLLTIGFLAAIILSKNLLTILLFYQFLCATIYFAARYFSPSRSVKAAKYFGFFILATSSLLFLAAALTFKISGNINFIQDGVFAGSKIDIWQFSLLLFFYILAIAAIAFMPFYLFFGNLYYLNPPAILLVLLAFAFSALIILFKVISYIFGAKLLAVFMPQINHYNLLTGILALNLLALALLAIASKNLKQILTWLFFNQMIAVIMAFIIFGLSQRQMQIVIVSFVLTQLLIFSAVGNINLYLRALEDKTLNGIFYKLRITILGLIFALLNLSGLIPAIGMVEKYWLFKVAFNDKSLLNALLLLTNIGLVLICIFRMVYPMLEISEKKSKNDEIIKKIAWEIEWDLNLILPLLILPVILLMMAIPMVTEFFIK
ncbi:MAG: hypothetical protein V4612_07505 [Pseudomonadota bacterium]